MTEPELKPCPFCGSNVTIEVSENGKAGAFVCTSGSLCIGSGLLIGFVPEDRDSSIAAWNTRAIDPAVIREAALREAAAVCIGVSNDILTQIGREHERWMRATAEDCSKMILALIGEKE